MKTLKTCGAVLFGLGLSLGSFSVFAEGKPNLPDGPRHVHEAVSGAVKGGQDGMKQLGDSTYQGMKKGGKKLDQGMRDGARTMDRGMRDTAQDVNRGMRDGAEDLGNVVR